MKPKKKERKSKPKLTLIKFCPMSATLNKKLIYKKKKEKG